MFAISDSDDPRGFTGVKKGGLDDTMADPVGQADQGCLKWRSKAGV